MQLKVISKEGIKFLKDVEVGDKLLCDNGKYLPVKSKYLIITHGIYFKLSNGITFHIYPRIKVKTLDGMKIPELWDTLYIDKKLQPVVVLCQLSEKKMIIYDILIDGNVVSPEGIIFSYS